MLPKNSRISRQEFAPLLQSRLFFHSPHFSLRVAHSTRPQIAVSVSKRISKKASTRNTIRRRTYSLLRGYIKNLKPEMLLFVAKVGADKIKGKNLEIEIEKLLKDSNLVQKS